MKRHFIPLALDTYFRGDSQEMEFCKQVGAGGNHVAVCTAGGIRLGGKGSLRLRERELSKIVEEFAALPEAGRKPALPDRTAANPPKRPVPGPPEEGLILRGYCAYLRRDGEGKLIRSKEYYYRQNPDRWPVETQSDLLWLTESEWKALVPPAPRVGEKIEVSAPVQQRFYGTIGIDYMEGSVNSVAPREMSMTLTVKEVSKEGLLLSLEGAAKMGRPVDESTATRPSTRGCEVRVVGLLEVDPVRGTIRRFDAAGVGKAWGNKMEYIRREIRLDENPWTYGIAVELVTGRRPMDIIPPYNMLHYGSGVKYFHEK